MTENIPQNQPTQAPIQQSQAQQDEEMTLKNIIFCCLSHWQWFVLSTVVCLGIATYRLLSTPPVYQRQATIMIKDEGKNSSVSMWRPCSPNWEWRGPRTTSTMR